MKMFNGDINKKFLNKSHPEWMYKYMSSSYCYLRQAWLTTFVENYMKILRLNRDDFLSKNMT